MEQQRAIVDFLDRIEKIKQREGWDVDLVVDRFRRKHGRPPSERELMEAVKNFNRWFLYEVGKDRGLFN